TNNVPPDVSSYIGEDGDAQLPGQFDSRFVSVNAAGAQNVSQSVFNSLVNFGDVGAGIEVQALFSAFEADNLGEVLATPSVKVMDAEEGRIQVGEDFSIKQRDFAGNVTDQFFSTGTILTVTPQIVDYQDTTFIYLDLEVERSSAQPDPVSTVISKEQASTHTLLLNGESTVIAGLYRTDSSEVRRGLPILKDLPGWFFGLKYLFGYNSTDISQTELIVLVQAEIEESIPDRMTRQLQSKRELLELQQVRHRQELDFVSSEEPDASIFDDPGSGGDEENVRGDLSGDSNEETAPTDPEPVNDITDPEAGTSVDPETDEAVSVRPGTDITHPQIDRQDLTRFQGEYRPVEMENMNGDYSNLLFYTIGGSFVEESNARRMYRNLKQDGYDAHILYNPGTAYYFVAYAGFEDLEEAVNYTRRIQSEMQPEAWLSTIITEELLGWDNGD
ncbi:MAG: SPOR domain-containing protein, partial [Balneolaceae bacterium]